MKEFRHLTAMSVKLKFPELELTTRELIKHVANHPFHEIYDLMTSIARTCKRGRRKRAARHGPAAPAVSNGKAPRAKSNSWDRKCYCLLNGERKHIRRN